MIRLQDIAYVRSGAADLAGAVRFAVDIVGLELMREAEGHAYPIGGRTPPLPGLRPG